MIGDVRQEFLRTTSNHALLELRLMCDKRSNTKHHETGFAYSAAMLGSLYETYREKTNKHTYKRTYTDMEKIRNMVMAVHADVVA